MPSHFTRHLQGHIFFRKLPLEYAFGSSNTKLKLLIILVIILLFCFGPQLGFEFEKWERFNLETAIVGAL